VRAARSVGAEPLFFTWQNLLRRYPPPFNWFERIVYRSCAVAIAGNAEAREVLVRKGYRGEIVVLPQFGVDPTIFRPQTESDEEERTQRREKNGALKRSSAITSQSEAFHIGYAGGLLPEKGLDLLLRACAGLEGDWRLTLVGSGEELEALRKLASEGGIADRVTLGVRLPSAEMPDFYRSLDLLVLPSRTRPNWKEQFGRVLIEAMASGVPVLGSDSGEIPHVIGSAGVVFPEGDVGALRSQLQRLMQDRAARECLAAAGRERVLAQYTMAEIARQTVAAYTAAADGR
jgi:glycosyltransferase involved in cell wall biosynthesis